MHAVASPEKAGTFFERLLLVKTLTLQVMKIMNDYDDVVDNDDSDDVDNDNADDVDNDDDKEFCP